MAEASVQVLQLAGEMGLMEVGTVDAALADGGYVNVKAKVVTDPSLVAMLREVTHR